MHGQVSLTPDGERLFERCQRVLAEVEDLHAEAAGTRALPAGTLRIDLPIVYGKRFVLPLLAELVRRHPGCNSTCACRMRMSTSCATASTSPCAWGH